MKPDIVRITSTKMYVLGMMLENMIDFHNCEVVESIQRHRDEDGSWRIEFKDSKGAEPTRDWRNKQKQAASLGINVETI